jgi:nucleoside-diphosphate-sugar epimerase
LSLQEKQKILVTGARGQIGTELTVVLRQKYGAENVVAIDLKPNPSEAFKIAGPYHIIDVNKIDMLEKIVKKYEINTIYHLAAILSATGEQNPLKCWEVNICGLLNVFELALKYKISRVFVPSSIAVWGPGIPVDNTPQETVLKPTTMYGITKVTGELLGNYYVNKFGLDVRGVRYPGIISSEALPGGGTTDYAVAIYYEAVDKKHYTCFVREDTVLPMMYMPDCIKAAMNLMEADGTRLKHHCDFNVAAISFSAGELAASIRKYIPDFTIDYKPDKRQKIADSWPNSIDDSCARTEWGWKSDWDLDRMTRDMIEKLSLRKKAGKLYQ